MNKKAQQSLEQIQAWALMPKAQQVEFK